MIEWWNSMDLVGQIFALIAVPSTLVLVVQTILLLVGIGGDDTLFALKDGVVRFERKGKYKTRCSVHPVAAE